MALRLLEKGRQTVLRTVLGRAFPDYLVTEDVLKQVTGSLLSGHRCRLCCGTYTNPISSFARS